MKRPSFQFYPLDWLGDTKITLMKPEYEGAYIRLLAYCWMEDGLPTDDESLAALSRLGEGWFNGGSTVIKKCFYEKDGKLQNKRLDSERIKQDEWSKKSSQGGKKSAEKRASQKEDFKGGSSGAVEPNGNTSSSTSSSKINKKKKIKKRKNPEVNNPPVVVTVRPHEITEKTWESFLTLRKAKKAPVTQTVLSEIEKEATKAGWSIEQALAKMCARGWQGFEAAWVAKEELQVAQSSNPPPDPRAFGGFN